MKRVISLLSLLSLIAVACQDSAAPPLEPPAPVPAAIPLLTWVHALVTDDPEGLRAPDTVHDKNIEDTNNPEAFAEFLPTP